MDLWSKPVNGNAFFLMFLSLKSLKSFSTHEKLKHYCRTMLKWLLLKSTILQSQDYRNKIFYTNSGIVIPVSLHWGGMLHCLSEDNPSAFICRCLPLRNDQTLWLNTDVRKAPGNCQHQLGGGGGRPQTPYPHSPPPLARQRHANRPGRLWGERLPSPPSSPSSYSTRLSIGRRWGWGQWQLRGWAQPNAWAKQTSSAQSQSTALHNTTWDGRNHALY